VDLSVSGARDDYVVGLDTSAYIIKLLIAISSNPVINVSCLTQDFLQKEDLVDFRDKKFYKKN
jgi:hypothetical protein